MQSKHAETYKNGLKYQKVQQHVKENKKIYIVGGSCLGVGFMAGLIARRPITVNVNVA